MGRWKHGKLLPLDIEEVLSLELLILMFISSIADAIKSFDTVVREYFGSCLDVVSGFLAGFVMHILNTMLTLGCGLSWHLVLVSPGLVMGVFLKVVL